MEKYLPKINSDSPLIEKIRSDADFAEVFSYFRNMKNTALLNSSLNTDAGRFSFIGLNPFLSFSSRKDSIKLEFDTHIINMKGDPFAILSSIIDTYKTDHHGPLPLTAGGIGYFSYDLKDMLETLTSLAKDDLDIPDIHFIFYRTILAKDNLSPEDLYICTLDMDPGCVKKSPLTASRVKDILATGNNIDKYPAENSFEASISSNFTKEKYIEAINRVIGYIRSGDIYQACLSQRFEASYPYSGYHLYSALNRVNPSPFSAYLNFDEAGVISSSPELFLRSDSNEIETRPMKGTRPRGENADKDNSLRQDLLSSSKDAAELAMIVDLERNDLGKISLPGSVEILEHRRIETYPTVFQTISVIKSKASDDAGLMDIIKAAFPGGSITGCPKIRAMEIIDELEPTKRSVYTGSIGYISFHNTMDLNIAIRTIIKKGSNIYFQTGGGITIGSDPEEEYNETLHKARAIFKSLGVELSNCTV